MTNESIKYMDLREFWKQGWLQEVNRLFFHPRGLALEMTEHDSGEVTLSGIWDYRDDPEGIIFGDGPDAELTEAPHEQFQRHAQHRIDLMGNTIQPVDFP